MAAMESREKKIKTVVTNRKAFRDYEIFERKEAGIELLGSEVKAIRLGKVNISDSYATIEHGDVILHNLHISPYEMAGRGGHDPLRPRRLLFHKKEIRKLFGAAEEKGFTLIPLKIYFKGAYVKIEVAVCRGRKMYDKREVTAKKEADRAMERALRRRTNR
jgi:SsrA-binding protein